MDEPSTTPATPRWATVCPGRPEELVVLLDDGTRRTLSPLVLDGLRGSRVGQRVELEWQEGEVVRAALPVVALQVSPTTRA